MHHQRIPEKIDKTRPRVFWLSSGLLAVARIGLYRGREKTRNICLYRSNTMIKIKKTLTFIVVVILSTTLLKASLSEKELSTYRDAVLKNGARAVLKNYSGTGYVFEIATGSRTVEMLFLFAGDIMKQPDGDVFVRVIETNKKASVPLRVVWSKVTAVDCARFFYVLDYSEVFNLGERKIKDPFKTVMLGQGVTYRSIAKKAGRELTVERQRGDSLPADYLFNFLVGTFGLGQTEEKP